jgi:hypothetical protein
MNNCKTISFPYEPSFNTGGTPGSGNIADGTAVNNTTRWDGTKWAESDFLTNDGTKVGVGALNSLITFNVEDASTNGIFRAVNTGTGYSAIFASNNLGATVQINQGVVGAGNGLQIAMENAGTGKSILINSNKSAGDHFVVNQNVGGYKDIFRIDFLGNILSNPLKTITTHPASYHALYVDSATGLVYSEAVAGGGLDYWTESEYTYSGATGTKFIPNSVNTDQSIVLSPKGTGGIIARQPDGTTAGGNVRGNNSIDLQLGRTSASQVASGTYSALFGGSANTASGTFSIVMGGQQHVASAQQSIVAGGFQSTASGLRSGVFAGSYQTASGPGSFIGSGDHNTASGTYAAIVGGFQLIAPSFAETVVGTCNTIYTPTSTIGYSATDRVFVVGNGTNTGSRSDAFVIFKNGNAELQGTLKIGAYTLPATDGTAGQVLKTDGAGNLSWSAP